MYQVKRVRKDDAKGGQVRVEVLEQFPPTPEGLGQAESFLRHLSDANHGLGAFIQYPSARSAVDGGGQSRMALAARLEASRRRGSMKRSNGQRVWASVGVAL